MTYRHENLNDLIKSLEGNRMFRIRRGAVLHQSGGGVFYTPCRCTWDERTTTKMKPEEEHRRKTRTRSFKKGRVLRDSRLKFMSKEKDAEHTKSAVMLLKEGDSTTSLGCLLSFASRSAVFRGEGEV